MLIEEERLFFLLIDIMRSPHVFKEITGNSIRDHEKTVEDLKKPKPKRTYRSTIEKEF
jgi:hypothetical protein